MRYDSNRGYDHRKQIMAHILLQQFSRNLVWMAPSLHVFRCKENYHRYS